MENTLPPIELGSLVIVRGGTNHQHSKFESLCRVIRQTGKRCYVELVEARSRGGFVDGVHGYEDTGQYVNKTDIMVESATIMLFRKLVELEKQQKEWLAALSRQEEEELAPIHKRFVDRRVQRFAQFDDEVGVMVKAEHK